ncbi:DUF4870 domain-containing protein [Flavobacterium psychrotrophum]|uniref:DUF4870 domain-containing protein n=1 Tax=Flavobacterium psychrotrophum TaxID=2294119 RepID=UPI000E310246|nr:DUF4870 domain-containing protein [Flavobacterium psychrotrophum]
MNKNIKTTHYTVYPQEFEQAGNSYLMSLVTVIAGLPLPIVNVLASFIFYLSNRKSGYFVRWHAIQSIIAQAIVLPFNSIFFIWTFRIIISQAILHNSHYDFDENFITFASPFYWSYVAFILLFNLFEFIAVLATAIKVRRGQNVRWYIIANITDAICSKQNHDPYRI